MKRILIMAGVLAVMTFSAGAQETDTDVLRSRASNGDVQAATLLGKYYFDIEKDAKRAEKWIKSAADAGDAEALYYLARIYDESREGKHPNKEVVSILEKSAGLGYTRAQVMLGKIYQFGRRGIPQDLRKAKTWYELAAAKGANEALFQLNVIYQQSGDAYTKAAMADENIEWLEMGVKQGNAEAALNLAGMAETGRGVPQDYKRAAELYQIAADAGIVQAQAALGKLYANGEGVPQDNEKAIFWLTKAAEEGYVEAQRKLAQVYTYQNPDPSQAYAWQVVSLSALFPQAKDLVAVSPDLERLIRSMTPEQIKDGQALAVKLVDKCAVISRAFYKIIKVMKKPRARGFSLFQHFH